MENNDGKFIADYLNGNEEALNRLVKSNLKIVYNFVYHFTLNKQDAKDLTQEVFVKVWKNLKKYRQGESFKAWILAIARNSAIDWLRKKKEPTFSDFKENESGENIILADLADLSPLPDEIIAKADDTKFLEKILNKLPPLYKEILILRYNDHLTFDEISKVTGKSINTVKSQHRRAIIQLRKLLK